MKNKKSIIASALILMVAAYIGLHYYLVYKSAPKINPHPKYFVTISGNIEPHMPYPQSLMFRATYAAYNPHCQVWISRFAGISGMPGHPDYYPVYPNAKGDYRIRIPIDRYKPGKCNWKIAWVMVAYPQKIPPKKDWDSEFLWSDMIGFDLPGGSDGIPGYPAYPNSTLRCGKGGIDNCLGNTIAGGYANSDVLRNKSYTFTQNIKDKKGE